MEAVLIVGAGPAGLATAACLKRLEVPFTLVDRTGQAGGSFRQMPRSMNLLSPRRYVHLPYLPYPGREEYPSIPEYKCYLEQYAQHFAVKPEAKDIADVNRDAEGFEVRSVSGPATRWRFVVIATGLFGNPVWPEIDGLAPGDGSPKSPTITHAHDWTDPNSFARQRILIIGAGISGVSIAEECANAGAQVFVSRRTTPTRLVPPRILGADILHWFRPVELLPRFLFGSWCRYGVHPPAYDNGYRALTRAGKITEVPEITRVADSIVHFADGTRQEVNAIVLATGYRFETPFLPAAISRLPGGQPVTKNCESANWPGLFFMGAPCGRRIDSEFLRGISSDAVRTARCIARRLESRL